MMDDDEQCDLCSNAGPLHLHAKCHGNAPLHATLEGGEIVLRCYVPSCMRVVARYRIDQGFPEKFAMQNTIGNQAAEIARLQAERDHWKANHDAQVARNTILRDRTDLPPEQWAKRQRYKDDAERYRWLRQNKPALLLADVFGQTWPIGTDWECQLDAAIDAARRE